MESGRFRVDLYNSYRITLTGDTVARSVVNRKPKMKFIPFRRPARGRG